MNAQRESDRADGSPEPTVADVLQVLEEDIIFGRLAPRERLVEDQLMQRFGAKRHVVRQAIAGLERMQIVSRELNKGARVRDFSRCGSVGRAVRWS